MGPTASKLDVKTLSCGTAISLIISLKVFMPVSTQLARVVSSLKVDYTLY